MTRKSPKKNGPVSLRSWRTSFKRLISRFIAAIALSPRLHNATDLDAVGWAVDRKPLTWLIVNWCFRNHKCFTCQFRPQYRRTRSEVFPILSRIQNIGCEMGEDGRSPEWYRANQRTLWVAKQANDAHEWSIG